MISQSEEKDIAQCKGPEQRTEVLIDILELKPSGCYEVFLEAVGEIYPHIYLMLTDHDDDDLDGNSFAII